MSRFHLYSLLISITYLILFSYSLRFKSFILSPYSERLLAKSKNLISNYDFLNDINQISSSISEKSSSKNDSLNINLQSKSIEFAQKSLLVKSLTELKIDDEALLDSILSNSNIAYKTWKIKSIERFLDPEELFAIESAFKDIIAVEYRFFGGYPQAERKIAYFRRVSAQDTEFNNGSVEDISEIEKDFRYFKISGNFIFEKLTLSEFRNSIIDLFNIKNYQLGDVILTGETGCQFITDSSTAASHILAKQSSSSLSIGSVPISCVEVQANDLNVRKIASKEINSVEASVRLDAIASTGYGMSRNKICKLIESGQVRVNYKVIDNAAYSLQIGQVISIQGQGSLNVQDINITAKGRYKIKMMKGST